MDMFKSPTRHWYDLFQLLVLLLAVPTLPTVTHGQTEAPYEISCQVEKVAPHLSITRSELLAAETIADLNPHYKPEWVAEYVRVDIATSKNRSLLVQSASTGTLTESQKTQLASRDDGTPVTVTVQYLPNNTLTQKEEKTLDFTVLVEPDHDAAYPGGPEKLKAYLSTYDLKQKAKGRVAQYLLSAVAFTVNEKGDVVDVKIAQTTEDRALDELLIKAACNMPQWTPASYLSGEATAQDLVLTLGDRESCMINVLNIKRDAGF